MKFEKVNSATGATAPGFSRGSGIGMVSFVKSDRRPLTEGAKRQSVTRIHSIGCCDHVAFKES
jgi:hypothetical protein